MTKVAGVELTPAMIEGAIKLAAMLYEYARDMARKKGATQAEWEARWDKAKSDHAMTLADHIAALGGAYPPDDPPPTVEPPVDPPPPPVSIYEIWFGQPPAASPYVDGDVMWVQMISPRRYIILRPQAVTAGPNTERYAVKIMGSWVNEAPVIVIPDEPPYVPPVEPPPVDLPVDPPPPVEPPVDPTNPHPPPVALPYRTPLNSNPLVANPWGFPNGCHVWTAQIAGKTVWLVVPIDGGFVWPGAVEIGIIGMS